MEWANIDKIRDTQNANYKLLKIGSFSAFFNQSNSLKQTNCVILAPNYVNGTFLEKEVTRKQQLIIYEKVQHDFIRIDAIHHDHQKCNRSKQPLVGIW